MDYIAHQRPSDQKEQSVAEHVNKVADFCERWGRELGLGSTAELLGKLHDMGKMTAAFTEYLRYSVEHPEDRSKRGTIDHSTAGAQYIYGIDVPEDACDRLLVEIAAMIICSHHGGLINYLDPDCKSEFMTRMKKDKNEIAFAEACANYFGNCSTEAELKALYSQAKNELSSIFGFDSKSGKIKSGFDCAMLIKLLFSYLIDADRLDTFLFMENREEEDTQDLCVIWEHLLEKLEVHLNKLANESAGSNIGALRQKISDECKAFADKQSGIYSLTVPTGGGKTLSGFRYALAHAIKHKKKRIVYVVPFTTIVDQNAADIKEIFREDDLILEHHSNLIADNENEDYKLLTERWSSPIIFTTMVQFLNTLFKGGTQSVRRLHQLSDAVIIFDEVQALPVKCTHLFNLSLNFLSRVCNSTILLCTATQPALAKVERPILKEAEAEMVSDLSEVFRSFKRVEVISKRRPGGYSYEEMTDLVFEELDRMEELKSEGLMDRSPSALIILNTKKNAEKLYCTLKNQGNLRYENRCKDESEKYQVFHLSTKMSPAHRMKVLGKIKTALKNDKRVICISTQLIEAGVNISFGSVFRALAGLDNIAQAAGRGNRHGEEKQARVYIINLEDENLSMLPEIKQGQNATEHVLYEYDLNPESFDHDLLSPAAIDRYFECYYASVNHQMDFPVTLENGMKTGILDLLNENKTAAVSYRKKYGKAPETLLTHAFRLAGDQFYVIEENTRSVLVPFEGGKEIIQTLNGANVSLSELNHQLRLAQRYSVNLFPNEYLDLCRKEGIYTLHNGGILAMKDEFYNEETGWELEAQRMSLLSV